SQRRGARQDGLHRAAGLTKLQGVCCDAGSESCVITLGSGAGVALTGCTCTGANTASLAGCTARAPYDHATSCTSPSCGVARTSCRFVVITDRFAFSTSA